MRRVKQAFEPVVGDRVHFPGGGLGSSGTQEGYRQGEPLHAPVATRSPGSRLSPRLPGRPPAAAAAAAQKHDNHKLTPTNNTIHHATNANNKGSIGSVIATGRLAELAAEDSNCHLDLDVGYIVSSSMLSAVGVGDDRPKHYDQKRLWVAVQWDNGAAPTPVCLEAAVQALKCVSGTIEKRGESHLRKKTVV
jgi:hypothetical protein